MNQLPPVRNHLRQDGRLAWRDHNRKTHASRTADILEMLEIAHKRKQILFVATQEAVFLKVIDLTKNISVAHYYVGAWDRADPEKAKIELIDHADDEFSPIKIPIEKIGGFPLIVAAPDSGKGNGGQRNRFRRLSSHQRGVGQPIRPRQNPISQIIKEQGQELGSIKKRQKRQHERFLHG